MSVSDSSVKKIDYKKCMGCGVCVAACPQKCISLNMNQEGFFTSQVDDNKCTSCGLCTRVCPQCEDYRITETFSLPEDAKCYEGWLNELESLKKSASGGIAFALKQYALKEGYKVCAVKYNGNTDMVEYFISDDIKELEKSRGSLYLQSITYDTFSKFEKDIKYIVFGLPCQIMALHKWLIIKGIRDNFILVDLFCEGVPPYIAWFLYAEDVKKKFKANRINNVNFRNKDKGWHNFTIKIDTDKGIQNKYFKNDKFFAIFGYYTSIVNNACYTCPFRCGISGSDIRIGDYWSNKHKNNEAGVSAIVVYSQSGDIAINKIKSKCTINNIEYKELVKAKSCSVIDYSNKRKDFIDGLFKYNSFNKAFNRVFLIKHIEVKTKKCIKTILEFGKKVINVKNTLYIEKKAH